MRKCSYKKHLVLILYYITLFHYIIIIIEEFEIYGNTSCINNINIIMLTNKI